MAGSRSKKGKRAREKGQEGEREAAKILSEELGFPIKRILDQTREGGHDLDIPGYAIEVKRGENISLPAAIRQVKRSAADSGIDNWAVVYRANNSPWRVVLSTDIEGLATLSREEIKAGDRKILMAANSSDDSDTWCWMDHKGPIC